MGLFGKSFEEKVKEAIGAVAAKVPGVRGLEAKVQDKIVTLEGVADSIAAKGAAMRAFNALVDTENTINAIRLAEAPARVEPAPASQPVATAPAERWHVVEKGDTLGKIAQKHLGKASLYPKIFEANRDVLKDPDKIFPGQKLRIPQ
jgi:nucleoid-associated protein YgaU